jgi:hypothetical protein
MRLTKAPHPKAANDVPARLRRIEPTAASPPLPNSKPQNDLAPAPEASSIGCRLTSNKKKFSAT